MTAVAEVVTEPTLEELAETANNEHLLCEEACGDAFAHAIRAGEALLIVRPRVELGKWQAWQRENLVCSLASAYNYMRLAEAQHELSGVSTINDGLSLLRGRGHKAHTGFAERYDERRVEARKLKGEGWSAREISEAFGVDVKTIYTWLDPEKYVYSQRTRKREYMRRRAAEAKALKDQERARTIKKALVNAGQGVNEAYKLATRLDGILGQARSEATTNEQRLAINEAHAARDKMMDAIIKALGVS